MMLRYLVLTALRDRLVTAMMAGLVAIWLLASFAGGTSILETAETGAAFAAFGARLLIVLGMTLFVIVHVRRLMESRELHLLLAKPIGRARFVVTAWASFALVALALALVAGVIVWLAGTADGPAAGLAAWTGTLILEAGVMTAFAVFVALGLDSAIASIVTAAGFYVLARMLGVLLAIARTDLRPGGALGDGIAGAVDVIGAVVPRLDLFAVGTWPVHGLAGGPDLRLVGAQGVIYTILLVAAAVFDFSRRQV